MFKKIAVLAAMALFAVVLLGLPAAADTGGEPNPNGQENAQGGRSEGQGQENAPGQTGDAQGGNEGDSAGGGTQGNSDSNPDGVGVDKPYPADGQPAGSQGPGYHDGNNGCGQDKKSGEARETGTEHIGWDDNNGWCGKPPSRTSGPNIGGTTMAITSTNTSTNTNTTNVVEGSSTPSLISSPVSVLGMRIERPQVAPAGVFRVAGAVEVLGVRYVQGEPLPLTGAPNVVALLLAAATMIFIGFAARKRATVKS